MQMWGWLFLGQSVPRAVENLRIRHSSFQRGGNVQLLTHLSSSSTLDSIRDSGHVLSGCPTRDSGHVLSGCRAVRHVAGVHVTCCCVW
jgi:hypothetical protein